MQIKSEPKEILEQLFGTITVSRVFAVDDTYSPAGSADDIVDMCIRLGNEVCQPIFTAFPQINFADDEVRNSGIRAFWNEQDQAVRLRISQELRARTSKQDLIDKEAATKLAELFSKFSFVPLSLPEWHRRQEEIVAESAVHKTVILFDEDFRKGGGSAIEGLNIIKELQTTSSKDLICCLFSHNFDPSTFQEVWEQLCREHGLDQGRFVLIPKQFAVDNPMEFVRLLKLASIASQCNTLRKEAQKIVDAALTVAKQKVESISMYDLEEMVFRSSFEEGVWEPETLFRIFYLFHRSETRKQALLSGELHSLAGEVRELSQIATPSEAAPSHKIFAIQHSEIYESADYLNPLRRPTELGDIYEKDGGKRYILIAAPCDLMVRNTMGMRGENEDLLREAALAEITTKNKKGRTWKLDFYDEGTDYYVDLKKITFVKLWALDMCVFNDAGQAIFSLKDNLPKYLIHAWKLRFGIVTKFVKEMLSQYERIKPTDAQRDDVVRLLTRISNEKLFTGKIDPEAQTLSFGFRRVARLRDSRSIALLSAYTSFLSRDAFEHPLETVQPPSGLINIKEASPVVAVTAVIDSLGDGVEPAASEAIPVGNLPAAEKAGIAEANPQRPKERKVPAEEDPK